MIGQKIVKNVLNAGLSEKNHTTGMVVNVQNVIKRAMMNIMTGQKIVTYAPSVIKLE